MSNVTVFVLGALMGGGMTLRSHILLWSHACPCLPQRNEHNDFQCDASGVAGPSASWPHGPSGAPSGNRNNQASDTIVIANGSTSIGWSVPDAGLAARAEENWLLPG